MSSKLWWLVANLAEVKEPGFEMGLASLMVLGVDQLQTGGHCGASGEKACLPESLKKPDIDIIFWIWSLLELLVTCGQGEGCVKADPSK